jgi:hypothetical protein
MRSKNRVVISTGCNLGDFRLIEKPNGVAIAETIRSFDSLGNPRWTSATRDQFSNMVSNLGSRLGWRIDTKARARRARYEANGNRPY